MYNWVYLYFFLVETIRKNRNCYWSNVVYLLSILCCLHLYVVYRRRVWFMTIIGQFLLRTIYKQVLMTRKCVAKLRPLPLYVCIENHAMLTNTFAVPYKEWEQHRHFSVKWKFHYGNFQYPGISSLVMSIPAYWKFPTEGLDINGKNI